MVRLLLEKGATINSFDKKDRRAIHWAAYMGHVDVVRLLVSFGAELRCTDTHVNMSLILIHLVFFLVWYLFSVCVFKES